jgi:phosphoglycerate dehydrogenase-like enzyme
VNSSLATAHCGRPPPYGGKFIRPRRSWQRGSERVVDWGENFSLADPARRSHFRRSQTFPTIALRAGTGMGYARLMVRCSPCVWTGALCTEVVKCRLPPGREIKNEIPAAIGVYGTRPSAGGTDFSRGVAMTKDLMSRRFFLSAAAAAPTVPALFLSPAEAAPAAPELLTFGRIAIFDPPPEQVRIVTANSSFVVPPPRFSEAEVKQIVSQGKNVEMILPKDKDELFRLLPEVNVVVGSVNAEMLARAKNLKWMQATEAGMERVLFPELVKSDVVVTNMARMFAPCISETAVAMLLALTRGLNKYYIPQFSQKKYFFARDLVEVDGMTMGIVGMGGLGSATAMRAHYGFNMRILATDAKPMVKPIFVDTLREPGWLMEMVPQVDVLVNAAALTKETKGIFDEKVFRAMKKTAYFLSLSRGGLVDQPALIQALKEGWIAGAGLDVVTPEPLPPDSPLWDCPNTIITCHTSGFSPQRRIRLMGLLAENVRRYANGLPLMNVVDKERGY